MAKLTRVTGKVFGGSAPLDEIGQFGSALAGDPTNTQDVATIQALSAYDEGWGSAVVSSKNFPPIEEVTGVLKTISYQGCYLLQEGIPEYDSGTNYSNTSVVKSVNGDELIFYLSQTNDNKGNPLTDTAHWARAIVGGRASFIGEIVGSVLPLNAAGLHLLDGTLISGSGSYADFVSYIANLYSSNNSANYFCTEAEWQTSVSTYGSCGKFVYDSVNNTVRLPKISSILEGTTDVTALGDLVEAGLPNITGTYKWGDRQTDTIESTGALYDGGTFRNYRDERGTAATIPYLAFDASRSNTIYGNSNTVQPQTIKVLYYIVVATSTKTQIQVDIDEIATDLNGKADVDLTNVNNQAKILMSGMGAVDISTYDELTLGASDSTYTAPANGYFQVSKLSTAAGQQIKFYVSSDVTVAQKYIAQGTGQPVEGFSFLCLKGQVIGVNYSLAGVTNHFRFYYAKGSESEAQ